MFRTLVPAIQHAFRSIDITKSPDKKSTAVVAPAPAPAPAQPVVTLTVNVEKK